MSAQTVLEALAGGPRTTAQLAAATGLTGDQVRGGLEVLRRRGLATSAGGVHGITAAGRAHLEAGEVIRRGPAPGRAGTRQGSTLRQRVWRYLRIHGRATLDDLLWAACDGTELDPADGVRGYLRALTQAGILVRTRSAWVLPEDQDTGPEAPSWCTATRTLRDLNSGRVWRL